jgi:hypothetical protein
MWRLLVPLALLLAFVDVVSGFAAYSSSTWNWSHTEVLTHWAAVREVCLVFFPIFTGALLVGGGLVALTLRWALVPREDA